MDSGASRGKQGPVPSTDWPVRLRGEWQLFVDDGIVAARQGLRRRIHQPRKHRSNPILVPDRPWEGSALLANGSILRDPVTGDLRMYHVSWGEDLRERGRLEIARAPKLAASSRDGLEWDKGAFRVPHRGWTETNVVLSEDGEGDRASFFHDPADPDAARRWKAVGFVASTPGTAGVYAYFSADGIRWSRHPRRIMVGVAGDPSASARGAGVCEGTAGGRDPKLGRYVAWVQLPDGQGSWIWAMSESEDFLTWSIPREILAPDEHDGEGHEFHGLAAWPHESLWLGLLRVYHALEGTSSFQLIASRDGRHWERAVDRAPFLSEGEPGSCDAGYLTEFSGPPIPVPAGTLPNQRHDELWFYYGATRRPRSERPLEGGICLARLRKHGFVSLAAGDDEGWILTRPFEVEGASLSVNANAARGEIRAEVCDPEGRPIQGFGRGECVPIWENGTDLGVAWSDALSLDSLRGTLVRVRFWLRNAALYAFAVR